MKKKAWILFTVLPLLAAAQEQGIHFEHNLTWQEVKSRAKAEGKYIFIDCYTSWCAPCKWIAVNIFPQKEAGDFFNKHFINIKLQLDKTPNDNANTIAWYDAAREIEKDYEISSYPTFLFFDPNGKIVHRFSGVSKTETAGDFVSDASAALDCTRQFYPLMAKYKSGDRSPALLPGMASIMMDIGDDSTAAVLATAYLASQKNIFTKESIRLIAGFTRNSSSNGFKFFLNNTGRIDSIMGRDYSLGLIGPIIANEEFGKAITETANGSAIQWDTLKSNIISKYPQLSDYADNIVVDEKTLYYGNTGNWKGFSLAVNDYIRSNAGKDWSWKLNGFASNILDNCNDQEYLSNALEWSKLSLKNNGRDPVCLNTYANLLYKLGRKSDALAYEQQAVSFAGESNNGSYQETLTRMKTGKKN